MRLFITVLIVSWLGATNVWAKPSKKSKSRPRPRTVAARAAPTSIPMQQVVYTPTEPESVAPLAIAEPAIARERESALAVSAALAPPRRGPSPAWAITSAVASVGALGVAIGFGVSMKQAESQHNALVQEEATRIVADSEFADVRKSAVERQRNANIMFGVAGGLTALSIALFAVADYGSAAPRVAITPLHKGGAVSLAGRF